MIKKFLNWKGGLIIGATSAIVIAAVASPIISSNAITASYKQKLNERNDNEATALLVQKFNFTYSQFKTAIQNLTLKDTYKGKLSASLALKLHNDKSYGFELTDAIDFTDLNKLDSNMEFEVLTDSETNPSGNSIDKVYVIGIDAKNKIHYKAHGTISGFAPEDSQEASSLLFDSEKSSIKVNKEVKDKTATAVALELQKLFSQQIEILKTKSASSTIKTTTPPQKGQSNETTSAEGVKSIVGPTPKASGATESTTDASQTTMSSEKIAEAFKSALIGVGGLSLKDSNGDFTILPDSYYIEPVVDENNQLRFSNVDNINQTLSIHVKVFDKNNNSKAISETTLNFDNLGETSEVNQEALINSFNSSYELKPGIAKALKAANVSIADVVYGDSIPAQLKEIDGFKDEQHPNVKDFDLWFEPVKTQKFGISLKPKFKKFHIAIAQGDGVLTSDEIDALKANHSLKLSITYSQHKEKNEDKSDKLIPQGFNWVDKWYFQAGTNLVVDTRSEFINQLVADASPILAASYYNLGTLVAKTLATTTTNQQSNNTQSESSQSDQASVSVAKDNQVSRLVLRISSKAPILFANHLDAAIDAFNKNYATNTDLALSQLVTLLNRSGDGSTFNKKTYGEYVKETLTLLKSLLPQNVTIALKGQFNKEFGNYIVLVKTMFGSTILNTYSFIIANVSAPNYAYDVASQYGANVFVDATFKKLVGVIPKLKENTETSKKVTKATLSSSLLNYNNFEQSFNTKTSDLQLPISTPPKKPEEITEGVKVLTSKGIQASNAGIALNKGSLTFSSPTTNKSAKTKVDTTLTNGTLWFAFKASALQDNFKTYFLQSRNELSGGMEGSVGLFIQKMPAADTSISSQMGIKQLDSIKNNVYVIGITYKDVKGKESDAEKVDGEHNIVALFTVPTNSEIKKDNNRVFQLKSSGAANTGNEYNNSTFKNKFSGNVYYSDFISKANNDDPTLLLEINIKNLPDPNKATNINNIINFSLYSSAIKDPLNNSIQSVFTQPVYVTDVTKKATSFISRGIDFGKIGDDTSNEHNYITFKAMAVFKDNDQNGVTQNEEVRRKIAKAFIDQYFNENEVVVTPKKVVDPAIIPTPKQTTTDTLATFDELKS